MRIEYITKYQNDHIEVVQHLGYFLENFDLKKSSDFFRDLGKDLGKNAVKDGLHIEEAIDGTIFLKQAIWKSFNKAGLLETLNVKEFYELNQIIGTLIDVLASNIAFTFHQERQYIENTLRYLAEASSILSSSLNYEDTLNTVAKLAVPAIADWCAVDLIDKEGKLHLVAVAHKDPKKVKWAKELRKKQPPDMNAPTGLPNILRTGKSELYPYITDEMLIASAKNKEELELLRKLQFSSVMIVPIKSSKKTIGALTFVSTQPTRHYTQADLLIAEELGVRASIAIENASLFKSSQEAITLRDDFISMASHELKTPITSVKMFTQVLKKHSEQIGDQKAVEHLSKMDKQINKLTELIYDLLNISKIQAGRMEFRHQKFNFDKLVTEVVEVLQQTSDKHKLIIEGKTGRMVFADEERIGQVLNNLITNAIKYSPKSDKVIIKLSSDKKNVKVEVRDFGIGMEKQHLGKIFERFYRVYDNTDKTFPGLGIGLYITSEIIKRHGGKLTVDSDIGKGSTFCFTLPIKK